MSALSQPFQTFPFLHLPAELRNEVYGWIFTDIPGQVLKGPRPKIALLQTCRQIHDEAIWILCSTNHFHMTTFRTLDHLNSGLPIVPPTYVLPTLSMLRNLTVGINLTPVLSAWVSEEGFCGPRTRVEMQQILRSLRHLGMELVRNKCSCLRTLMVVIKYLGDIPLRHIAHFDQIDMNTGGIDLLTSLKEVRVRSFDFSIDRGGWGQADEKTQRYCLDVKDIVEGRHESAEQYRQMAMYRDINAYARSLHKHSHAALLYTGLSNLWFTQEMYRLWIPLEAIMSQQLTEDLAVIAELDFEHIVNQLEAIYSLWLFSTTDTSRDAWNGEVVRAREWLFTRADSRDLVARRAPEELPELEHRWLVCKPRVPIQWEAQECSGEFIKLKAMINIVGAGIIGLLVLCCRFFVGRS